VFGRDTFTLSPEGIVLLSVPKGWVPLVRLECKDGSIQHIQIRGAHFFAQGDGWVSDFGDVAITWNASGGVKVSSMFGLIGAAIDESSDDGAMVVEIKGPAEAVRQTFRHQTGVEGRWVVHQLSQPVRHPAGPQGGAINPVATAAAPQTEPHGFFCASSPSRDDLNLCLRGRANCEQLRGALGVADVAACTSAETAWCYVSSGKLRCFGAKQACEVHVEKDKETMDVCAEQS